MNYFYEIKPGTDAYRDVAEKAKMEERLKMTSWR